MGIFLLTVHTRKEIKERSGNANQVCLTLKTTQNLPEKDSWYKNSQISDSKQSRAPSNILLVIMLSLRMTSLGCIANWIGIKMFKDPLNHWHLTNGGSSTHSQQSLKHRNTKKSKINFSNGPCLKVSSPDITVVFYINSYFRRQGDQIPQSRNRNIMRLWLQIPPNLTPGHENSTQFC